jgi:hypothetical protein
MAFVTDAFVTALANFLQAERDGRASPTHRSELAMARASAERLLNTKQYSEAVFKAFRVAGLDP